MFISIIFGTLLSTNLPQTEIVIVSIKDKFIEKKYINWLYTIAKEGN